MSDQRGELVWEFEKSIMAALYTPQNQQALRRGVVGWMERERETRPKAVDKDEQECFLHVCGIGGIFLILRGEQSRSSSSCDWDCER